jgi:hypothetical protein
MANNHRKLSARARQPPIREAVPARRCPPCRHGRMLMQDRNGLGHLRSLFVGQTLLRSADLVTRFFGRQRTQAPRRHGCMLKLTTACSARLEHKRQIRALQLRREIMEELKETGLIAALSLKPFWAQRLHRRAASSPGPRRLLVGFAPASPPRLRLAPASPLLVGFAPASPLGLRRRAGARQQRRHPRGSRRISRPTEGAVGWRSGS